MTPWQIARQIKFLLESRTWPGGSSKVFGDVRVTAATDEDTFGMLANPYVLINALDGTPYDGGGDPTFYQQAWACAVGTRVEGGQYGEEALLGGSRIGAGATGQQSSAGRGLLEIEEEFLKAVNLLRSANGQRASCTWRSAVGAGLVQGMGYVAQRSYQIECPCTAERYYHPPQDLTKSGNTVSWDMSEAASRYDFWKVRLFRKAGSTPPTYEEGGATEVTIADPTSDTSVTDVASTVAYSIFAVYDETHEGTPDEDQRQSSAGTGIPGTTIVVA